MSVGWLAVVRHIAEVAALVLALIGCALWYVLMATNEALLPSWGAFLR